VRDRRGPARFSSEGTSLSIVEQLAAAQRFLYRTNWVEMRPHFTHERAVERAYRGRQLLELLQNADDAGRAYLGTPRFLIRLTDGHLVAANAGQPFSDAGFTSLVVSDRSPKQLARGRYIGQKGLGFRALLDWSREVLVSSGSEVIAFSSAYAQREAAALAAEVPELLSDIVDFEREHGVAPVPVMRFPYSPAPDDPSAQIATAVRAEGFDTVIVLAVPGGPKGDVVRADIENQARDVGAPTLLFSNYLRELRVEVGSTSASWLVERQPEAAHGGVVLGSGQRTRETVVLQRDNEVSLWVIHRVDVNVPPTLLEDAGASAVGLAVAVPEHLPRDHSSAALREQKENSTPASRESGDDGFTTSTGQDPALGNTLCVYFPTSVVLPMAMLAHATLETDDSRKRLTRGPATRFALSELAAFIAWVASEESAGSLTPAQQWRGLELLAGIERCDPELVELGFRDAVLSATRSHPLFPRIDGHLAAVDDVRLAPNRAWARVGTRDWMGDMLALMPNARTRALIGAIAPPALSKSEQASRLESHVERLAHAGHADKAGALVGTLLEARALPSSPPAAALIAQGGRLLAASEPAFLPPEGISPSLPDWVESLHFLDTVFVEHLRAVTKSTGRELVRRLAELGYKIEEYQVDTIARRLLRIADGVDGDAENGGAIAVVAAGGDDVAEARRRDSITRHRDVLQFVFTMTRSQELGALGGGAAQATLTAPISAPFMVVTEGGVLRRASECYMGGAYPNGGLVVALYGPLGADEFCAGPEKLGLGGSAMAVEGFLIRIGVANRPRRVPLARPWDLKQAGLDEHVHQTLRRLQYPQVLAERVFNSAEHAIESLTVRYSGATLPDRWTAILRQGRPEAIVAYVMSEGLAQLDPNRVTGIRFEAMQGAQQSFRPCPSVLVSDPTIFLLREVPWVLCDDGERHPPRHIALTRLGRKALGRAFRAHALDTGSPLLASFGGGAAVQMVLQATGAVQALESLRGDDLYTLLMELPERDPSGEVASAVYRSIIETGQLDVESPLRAEFLQRGTLWGERGETKGYFPVDTLRYAPRSTVPEPVRRHVSLLAVDARRNVSEVYRVFGVRPLESDAYAVIVDEGATEPTLWSERAERHLRAAIPFLYALRLSQRAEDRAEERKAFVALRLVITRRIVAQVHIEERPPEQVVLEQDLSGLTSGRCLYLVAHDSDASFGQVIWRAVADLVADVLNLQTVGGDFGALLACDGDRDRMRLLEHLTGGRAMSFLAGAREALEMPEGEDEDDLAVVIPLPAPRQNLPASPPANAPVTAQAPNASRPDTLPSAVTEVAPPNAHPTGPRGLVITREPEQGPTTSGQESLANEGDYVALDEVTSTSGNRLSEAEAMAVVARFESLAVPPRFPVAVSHLRGVDALGCDMISLGSAEARDRVLAERSVNLTDIVRFIEVKGATTRAGAVELTANERDAAARFGERFYLYRVYAERPGQVAYEVAVLKHPTASPAERTSTRWSYGFSTGSGAVWYRVPTDALTPPQAVEAPRDTGSAQEAGGMTEHPREPA
jgi:hypothetical protein